MRKLLILIFLSSSISLFSQTYKVKNEYGIDTGVRIEKVDENFGSFPVSKEPVPVYDQSAELDKASAQGAAQGAAVGAALGNFYAKYGEQMKAQKAREGVKYLGNGRYELTKILGTGLVGVQKSIKKAKKELMKFVAKMNVDKKMNLSSKISNETGKKGVMGVYSEATINFELVDNNGVVYVDEIEESKYKEIKLAEGDDLKKIERKEAIAKLKEYKELLDLEIITQEEYDKHKSELLDKINGK